MPPAATPHVQPTTTPGLFPQATVAAAPNPKKRRSKRGRYIIAAIVMLVVGWIVTSVILSKREKPIAVTTEKAVRRTIVQTVSATGKIQPETEVKISPEVAGEIIELPVEDGMAVKKGDLLVRINPDIYKALLEQQEAAIGAAKAANLQQKATMTKTEQDMKRADDKYASKTI